MALPRKKARKIVVNDQHYYWVASGNDGYIDLLIVDASSRGQKLKARFGYHSTYELDGNATRLTQQLIITASIVKQVIKHGYEQSWTPLQKAPDLQLGYLDDKIDIR